MAATTDQDSPHRPSVSDRMRYAPVESGLGMRPVRVDGAGIALRAPLTDATRDTGTGRIAPLLVAMLADSGIGYLVFSAAKLVAGAPTLDLRIDQVGPASPEATAVTAELTLLHLDDEVGIGRAEVRDDTGTLVAHAVATMAITAVPDRPGGLATGAAAPAGGGTRAGAGDPDDFRAHVLPFDPDRLRPENLTTEPGDDGGPEVVFTPGTSATNLNGTTHGAVLAGLAQGAQSVFLTGRGPVAGSGLARPLSVTVDYLRPAQVDVPLRARTEQVRDGRRFWTLRTELLLPDGRPAARITGNGIWT
ncbi:acyl-coenzyme A thioesterase PaaI-like protein [Pseudonocardia sediminis]|uniref:Acyl-coenzyme A thioesterase PaaI-like protein n=1 Tax=Pseudonocardia sediminis TaxID=1397368 RepID=A0A4Q7UTI2_PSEST|nr:PaaI family thioesterase [Pseudonocardia sediminis]RZT85122.1 acyl-coenzyme A thioesterase PaaI-like protein [Pseudonocardia sediminis]